MGKFRLRLRQFIHRSPGASSQDNQKQDRPLITSLPPELLLLVLSHPTISEQCKLSQSCKYLHHICELSLNRIIGFKYDASEQASTFLALERAKTIGKQVREIRFIGPSLHNNNKDNWFFQWRETSIPRIDHRESAQNLCAHNARLRNVPPRHPMTLRYQVAAGADPSQPHVYDALRELLTGMHTPHATTLHILPGTMCHGSRSDSHLRSALDPRIWEAVADNNTIDSLELHVKGTYHPINDIASYNYPHLLADQRLARQRIAEWMGRLKSVKIHALEGGDGSRWALQHSSKTLEVLEIACTRARPQVLAVLQCKTQFHGLRHLTLREAIPCGDVMEFVRTCAPLLQKIILDECWVDRNYTFLHGGTVLGPVCWADICSALVSHARCLRHFGMHTRRDISLYEGFEEDTRLSQAAELAEWVKSDLVAKPMRRLFQYTKTKWVGITRWQVPDICTMVDFYSQQHDQKAYDSLMQLLDERRSKTSNVGSGEGSSKQA